MRFPQAIIIDPRKVLPSRHSVFIRGFPGSVNIEDIKELFSKQCDGKCKIDFFSYSEDKANLFLAIRFDSHGVAKRVMSRYDGERIFGHKVDITWFKDIRKARKKVIENEHKYQTLLAQPYFDVRRRPLGRFPIRHMGGRRYGNRFSSRHFERTTIKHCVSSSNSSRSRSRSSSFSRRSRSKSPTGGSNRNRSFRRRGSSSSGTSRSPPRPSSFKRPQRSPFASSKSRSMSCSSSSSSERSVLNGNHITPADRQTESMYPEDAIPTGKEVVSATAIISNSSRKRTHSLSRSFSSGSQDGPSHSESLQQTRDEPQQVPWSVDQRSPLELIDKELEEHLFSAQTDHDLIDRLNRDKPKKQSKHGKTKHAKRDKSPPTSGTQTPGQEMDVEDGLIPETTERLPTAAEDVSNLQDSPEEELPLKNIFLPGEARIPSPEKTVTELPKDVTPEETDSPTIERQVVTEKSPDEVLVTTSASPIEPRNFEDVATSPIRTNEKPKTDAVDFGIQTFIPKPKCTSIPESDDLLLQIATLTDTRVDDIFQQKRLIEAAYRIDCESITASIGKLIRLNPDLKDRLLSSLRIMLEDRAKQCINELREYIRKLRK